MKTKKRTVDAQQFRKGLLLMAGMIGEKRKRIEVGKLFEMMIEASKFGRQ